MGTRTSTEEIWREYHTRLRAFVQTRVREEEVDDVLQEVFLRTHSKLDSLQHTTKLTSWLYQITRNCIVDAYRKRRDAEQELSDETVDNATQSNALHELGRCIEPMIALLPDTYKHALIDHDLHGSTHKDLAKQAGISVSGAKSRVQRARLMLKEQLDMCCTFELGASNSLVGFEPKSHTCTSCNPQ